MGPSGGDSKVGLGWNGQLACGESGAHMKSEGEELGNARLQAVGRTEFKLQGRAELLLFEKEKGGPRVRMV